MKYRESQKDKKLRAWFTSDLTCALLRRVKLDTGSLRGLNSLDMNMTYPIAAIAGKNGVGKSTILAIACCGFHNRTNGYRLPKRKKSYYTFSDFFVQHSNEIPPQGISVHYWIAHNNWKKAPTVPDGTGIGLQERRKTKDGRWNDYDTRVSRNVIFLGIERIVPHIERSQSRSYSRYFQETPEKGWEGAVMDIVGYILGKKYEKFIFLQHSKYSLPVVMCNQVFYSGFNMGAGENALFEIFSMIYSAGKGALIVIDEIELGLHAEAQRRFVERLKDVCDELHVQIICTTHSSEIFECLPSDARFYVETVSSKTTVTQGVSSEFAFMKMSAKKGLELDILVEDDVAKAILLSALPSSVRSRVSILVIGSATALSRQLAALYVRGETKPVLAVFDGDQRGKHSDNLGVAKKMAERVGGDFNEWFETRVAYLPGESWPEAWLLQKSSELLSPLSAFLNVSNGDLSDNIEYALQAGKHNEFHELGKLLGLDRGYCLQSCAAIVAQLNPDELAPLCAVINKTLEDNV